MHDDMTVLMSLVLDGEATSQERIRLLEHLAVCDDCARLWTRWEAVDLEFTAAPVLMPPADFIANVMSRIEEKQRIRSHVVWVAPGILSLWAGTIAIAAALVALTVLWGMRHPVELGIVLASASQLLSGLRALLGGLRVLVGGFDPLTLGLLTGSLLACTSGLGLFWLWAVSRQTARAPRAAGLDV